MHPANGESPPFHPFLCASAKVSTPLRIQRERPLNNRGLRDKVPFGAAFGKGITIKMGQTNMHNYMRPLLERIERGQIDPSYIISHRITLDEALAMYDI